MKKNPANTEEERAQLLEAHFQKFLPPTKVPTKIHPIHWCPDINLFKIDAVHQFFGDQKVGFEVNKQWYLYPEEAIYLHYKGKVKAPAVTDKLENVTQEAGQAEGKTVEGTLDGVSLMRVVYNSEGVEDIYKRMYIYRCYEFFRRNNFHMRRYTQSLDIDQLKEGNEEIVKKLKEDKESVVKGLFNERPVFKVYETNQAYYKDQVTFYVVVVPLTEESFDIKMLNKLKVNFQQGKSQLKLALVDEDEVVVYELGSLYQKK